MSTTLKKHCSNPNMKTITELENYRFTMNQSRYSQVNPIQIVYSPTKEQYLTNSFVNDKTLSSIRYEPNAKDKLLKRQVQTDSQSYTNNNSNIHSNGNNKRYEHNLYYYRNSNRKQNIIEVNNWQIPPQSYNPYNSNKKIVKNKLSRNVYLNKQKPLQKKNNLSINVKQDQFIMTQLNQYPSFQIVKINNKQQDYSSIKEEEKEIQIIKPQDLIIEQLGNQQIISEGKFNRTKSQQNLQLKWSQLSNNLLGRFTSKNNQGKIKDNQLPSKSSKENTIQFKQTQFKNSENYNQEQQTKYQSKPSSRPQYTFQFIQHPNKPIIIPTTSSRQQSEKQSHCIYELKQSPNNSSTDDSGIVLASIQETKTSTLIKQFEQQNDLIEKQNVGIKKQIQDKIHYQRQLLNKLNEVMKLIENLKQKEIQRLKNNHKSSQKCQNKRFLLETYEEKKNKQIFNNKNQVRSKVKKQNKSKDSFDLTNHLKSNNPIYQEIQMEIQTPHMLRTSVENEKILEYSPIIQQSTFNAKKDGIFRFPSRSTLKDEILESNKYLIKENQIKSRRDFIDESITGFESYFVPRQNNIQKLLELQKQFEKEIKKCYSPKNVKQKKQNLRRLSEQIKNLRGIVEKQSSDTNLNMLLFSNTSLK